VREALRRHAHERRRWGYRRLLVLLRRDGFTDNHKRVHRIYQTEGLQVRQRRRRKQRLARGTERPTAPLAPNQRWSLDFVHDRLVNGRTLRLKPLQFQGKRQLGCRNAHHYYEAVFNEPAARGPA